MPRIKLFLFALVAFAVFSAPGQVRANAAADADASAISGLAPMDSNTLSGYAGGSFSITNDTTNITTTATASATSADNTIGNVGFTGGISNINVLGNAGLTSTITNTGNQVSISQSTAINISLH
jgi:hypothetical protein